jgi:hypothetical protein
MKFGPVSNEFDQVLGLVNFGFEFRFLQLFKLCYFKYIYYIRNADRKVANISLARICIVQTIFRTWSFCAFSTLLLIESIFFRIAVHYSQVMFISRIYHCHTC